MKISLLCAFSKQYYECESMRVYDLKIMKKIIYNMK